MTDEQRQAIEQLRDAKSAKRESAARKLSRKPCPEAGPALLEAFEAELEDPRTWKAKEAQAWALAHNPHQPALKLMLDLAGDDLGGSAVNDSVGSAAMGCGFEDPGPSAVLRALLGKGKEVETDRLAAVVGGLRMLPCDDDEVTLDEKVAERLLAIAAEDPPKTVPRGTNRRFRVSQLRQQLLHAAATLKPEQRARLIEIAEQAEYDPRHDEDWEPCLAAARELG